MGLMADSETWEAVLHGIYTEAHLSVNIHLRSLQRYFEWLKTERPSCLEGRMEGEGGTQRRNRKRVTDEFL